MDYYTVIEAALLYIDAHIDQPLSLDVLADAFNFSRFYFHRLFSAVVGDSLKNYILSRKLNASLGMIQAGDRSLTEIAYVLNFGSPSSFTRAFKREFGVAPSEIRGTQLSIPQKSIPVIVRRPMKNINGDFVSDFKLTVFEPVRIRGIVSQIDLAVDDYRQKINAQMQLLLETRDRGIEGRCYIVFSDCMPDSSRFNVMVGVHSEFHLDLPYFFTVDLPELYCAQFRYSGNLLEIGDVLTSDYARFLKVSRQEPGTSHIDMIQCFADVHDLQSDYSLFVPIKKLPVDKELSHQ